MSLRHRQGPLLNPFIGPPHVEVTRATKEQEAAALELTRGVVTAVRDLMRAADIPATEFAVVLNLYTHQLYGEMHKDDHKKYIEHEKRVREIVKQRETEAVKQFGAVSLRDGIPVNALGGNYVGAYPISSIEDQVRQELALEDDQD